VRVSSVIAGGTREQFKGSAQLKPPSRAPHETKRLLLFEVGAMAKPGKPKAMACSHCGSAGFVPLVKGCRPRCSSCGGPMLSCHELGVSVPAQPGCRVRPPRHRVSRNTVLWFGKFKGQAIASVPDEYLRRLLGRLNDPRSGRIKSLVIFLRKYLGVSALNGQATS
jgi:uncharacterized protein (DUF3820 family)